MSSKLGTILSSIFIVIAFLLGCDLMSIQFIYSDLDSKSINISYLISKNATFFDDEFTNYIESKFNVSFYCDKEGAPAFGETIDYTIATSYHPLMMSKESMTVSINRMTVVGYYG